MATTDTTAEKPKRAPRKTNANANGQSDRQKKVGALKGASQKLAFIQQQVHAVEKTGEVSFGQTKYAHMQEHGLLAVLRPLLTETNAALFFDVVEHERQGNHSFIKIAVTLYDADLPRDHPDWGITMHSFSEGTDSSDKGINKALTNGNKYALQKLFQIPTDQVDDVEGSDDAHNTQSNAGDKPSNTKKLTAAKAAELKAAALAAIEHGHTNNNQVVAKLQGEFNVSKIEELTATQAAEFAWWLKAKIDG